MIYTLVLFITVAGGVASYYPPNNTYTSLTICEIMGEALLDAREEAKGYLCTPSRS